MPAAASPPAPIHGARALFSLDPAVSHLNHGSFGAAPLAVQHAQQRLHDELHRNPMRFLGAGLGDRIARARDEVAHFLGADADGIAFVPNTTTGVSIVLNTVRLGPDREILTTGYAYGAVALAVARERHRGGAPGTVLPASLSDSDDDIVAAVERAIRPGRTGLVVVDLIASATARLLPVARIAAVARDAGVPVLVDAAHAPGMLPRPLAGADVDFWVGNLHKWGFAPPGAAVLAVSPDWRRRVNPLAVSWEDPRGFPGSVEHQGTADVTSWLAAPAGLATLRELGEGQVHAHNAALAAYGQRVVGEALGLDTAALPYPGGPHVSMRIVPLPPPLAGTTEEAWALGAAVGDELATMVAINGWQGRGYLRLSGQVYNRAEEYERLAEHLPAYLAGHGRSARA